VRCDFVDRHSWGFLREYTPTSVMRGESRYQPNRADLRVGANLLVLTADLGEQLGRAVHRG